MKLLEQVRLRLRARHCSYRTEPCYLRWIEQYIRFCEVGGTFRHPASLDGRRWPYRIEPQSHREHRGRQHRAKLRNK